jgi:hypothetical protein
VHMGNSEKLTLQGTSNCWLNLVWLRVQVVLWRRRQRKERKRPKAREKQSSMFQSYLPKLKSDIGFRTGSVSVAATSAAVTNPSAVTDVPAATTDTTAGNGPATDSPDAATGTPPIAGLLTLLSSTDSPAAVSAFPAVATHAPESPLGVPNASSSLGSVTDSAMIAFPPATMADKAVVAILPFLKEISNDKCWTDLISNWIHFEVENPPKAVSAIAILFYFHIYICITAPAYKTPAK